MSRIELGGATLELLAQKAIWWAAERSLLVADAHIGKAVSFRRLGVPVPHGTTDQTLDALAALIERYAAGRVIFLGDLLHSARMQASATLDAFADWRERRAGVDMLLVRGNHDQRAGDPPASMGIRCVDEPYCLPGAPGLALCHHPVALPGVYVLAGHAHPCVMVGRGIDRLRLPCFHIGAAVGVLPAFGAFTGMHAIVRAPSDRVYAVAENAVHALPPTT
jgi:DNA ligase-associated metallophosphoesterase